MAKRTSRELRLRRHNRLRRRVAGSAARPRLCVFRSNEHIYAQVIDDSIGHTLVAASTTQKDIRQQVSSLADEEQRKVAAARLVGRLIAERAKAVGISSIVFDRGGFKYHGRVQALAEAAREAGLTF